MYTFGQLSMRLVKWRRNDLETLYLDQFHIQQQLSSVTQRGSFMGFCCFDLEDRIIITTRIYYQKKAFSYQSFLKWPCELKMWLFQHTEIFESHEHLWVSIWENNFSHAGVSCNFPYLCRASATQFNYKAQDHRIAFLIISLLAHSSCEPFLSNYYFPTSRQTQFHHVIPVMSVTCHNQTSLAVHYSSGTFALL